MCVHSTFMRQEVLSKKGDGSRLVVHLFNDVNTTSQHALPVDDVPLREETLPIHDIRVTFAPQYQIDRVHLEPSGKALTVTKSDRGLTVNVPRLDVHAMVVAELSSEDTDPAKE